MVGVWLLASLVGFGAPAKVVAPQSAGGALSSPAVTPVEYDCRIGTTHQVVARDPRWPVYVVRVVVGERLTYELYAKPNPEDTVLLATCDQLLAQTTSSQR